MIWIEFFLISRFLTIISAPLPPYLEALKGIQKVLDGDVEYYFLPQTTFKNNIPIIAIGSDALEHTYSSDRTIIFSMVLYPENFIEEDNVYGVRFEPNPEDVVEKVCGLKFKINRVYILTTKYSEQYGLKLKYAFEKVLKKECIQLNGIKNIIKHIKEVKKEDIVIIPPDPELYTKETLIMITPMCFQKGVPVVGFSNNILQYGVLLSILPDYRDEGVMTAKIAKKVKSKEMFKKRFYYPDKVKIYINNRLYSLLKEKE